MCIWSFWNVIWRLKIIGKMKEKMVFNLISVYEYILCIGYYVKFWVEYKEKYILNNCGNGFIYCYSNYGNLFISFIDVSFLKLFFIF